MCSCATSLTRPCTYRPWKVVQRVSTLGELLARTWSSSTPRKTLQVRPLPKLAAVPCLALPRLAAPVSRSPRELLAPHVAVMTAAEAHAASLNAQDIHVSSRSPSAQVMRAGGRPSPHGMSGGSILERAGESVDHGPKLRPPGPHASSEGGEGGESGQGGGEVSPSVGPPAPAMSSENQLNETSEGRRLSPQLTSLQQQSKTKRFRERRLSKDLQETLQGNGADLKSQQQEQEATVAVADAEGSALSVEAAAEEAESPPTLPADESEADRNASVDARIDGKGIDGEPSFKDNQGSPSPSFSKTLSPVKKTMRLDIGKSGLPVDRGGHSGRKSIAISSEIEELVEDAVTPFDRSLVGTYSCHGAEPTATGSTAKINQDCACLTHPFARTPGTALFCVYDGHGKFGHVVSQEVLHSLLYELEENNERLQQDPAVLLAESFENVNVHLRLCAQEQPCVVDAADSGACAIVVWMRGRELVVAGAGDCRAVLGTRHDKQLVSVCLSTDHKVNLPVEQARIEAAGGWVRPETGDDDDFNPARLYEVEGKPWLGPGLCIARCLGDLKANKCGLIPTPEICMHTLQSTDLFLILASDGVWEFIDNDEAVAIVGQFYDKGLPALDACRFLIAKAALCWRKFEGDYRDDITAIVVYLPKIVTALEQEQMKYSQVSSDQAQAGKLVLRSVNGGE